MLHPRLRNFAALFCAANVLATCLTVGISSVSVVAADSVSRGDDPAEPIEQLPQKESSSEDAPDLPIQELVSTLTRSVDLLFMEQGSQNPGSTLLLYARLRCQELFRPPCV
jgi:hypothetical protein